MRRIKTSFVVSRTRTTQNESSQHSRHTPTQVFFGIKYNKNIMLRMLTMTTDKRRDDISGIEHTEWNGISVSLRQVTNKKKIYYMKKTYYQFSV